MLSASATAPQRRLHFVGRSCSAAMPAYCRRPCSVPALLLRASALAPQRRPCSAATPVPCRKRAAAHLLRSSAPASLPAGSASAPVHCRHPCSVAASLPGSSLIGVPASSPLCRRFPCQQQLRQGGASYQALCHGCALALPRRPSRQSSVPTVPGQQQLRHACASHQALRHGAPASNKPHSAEKSTAVWLAIWRIWAGFANSQLWRATFRSTYLYMCPSALLPL